MELVINRLKSPIRNPTAPRYIKRTFISLFNDTPFTFAGCSGRRCTLNGKGISRFLGCLQKADQIHQGCLL